MRVLSKTYENIELICLTCDRLECRVDQRNDWRPWIQDDRSTKQQLFPFCRTIPSVEFQSNPTGEFVVVGDLLRRQSNRVARSNEKLKQRKISNWICFSSKSTEIEFVLFHLFRFVVSSTIFATRQREKRIAKTILFLIRSKFCFVRETNRNLGEEIFVKQKPSKVRWTLSEFVALFYGNFGEFQSDSFVRKATKRRGKRCWRENWFRVVRILWNRFGSWNSSFSFQIFSFVKFVRSCWSSKQNFVVVIKFSRLDFNFKDKQLTFSARIKLRFLFFLGSMSDRSRESTKNNIRQSERPEESMSEVQRRNIPPARKTQLSQFFSLTKKTRNNSTRNQQSNSKSSTFDRREKQRRRTVGWSTICPSSSTPISVTRNKLLEHSDSVLKKQRTNESRRISLGCRCFWSIFLLWQEKCSRSSVSVRKTNPK